MSKTETTEEKERRLGLPPIRVAAGPSLVSRLNAVFSSAPAMVLTAGLAVFVSVSGIRDIHKRNLENWIVPTSGRGSTGINRNQKYDPSLLKNLPSERQAPSALEMARRANVGTLGGADAAGPLSASRPANSGAGTAPAIQDGSRVSSAGFVANGKKMPNRFGRLSTKLDGGAQSLNGGPGLSGGLFRPFSGPRFENSLLNKIKAMAAGLQWRNPASARAAAFKGGSSAQRLTRMNKAMTGVRGANPETQSAVHSREWASAGGVPILGAGDSQGAIDIQGAGEPGSGVGEIPTEPVPAASPSEVPSPQTTNDKTPDQGLIDVANMLLAAATAMTMLAFVLGMAAKAGAPFLYSVAKGLSLAAAMMAGVVALIGLVILIRGNPLQGTIFLSVGGLVTVMALLAADGYAKAAQAQAEAAQRAWLLAHPPKVP